MIRLFEKIDPKNVFEQENIIIVSRVHLSTNLIMFCFDLTSHSQYFSLRP